MYCLASYNNLDVIGYRLSATLVLIIIVKLELLRGKIIILNELFCFRAIEALTL